MSKPILYYVYDPMCSWCWGYRKTWQALQAQLNGIVDIVYQVGGLAPDNNAPMSNDMRDFLQATWLKISHRLGTQFNFEFWTSCQPKRSTYPACRAVIVARHQHLEQEMYYAIQQAYYLHAQNPSLDSTLVAIANTLGMKDEGFKKALKSQSVQQQLLAEISKVQQMPIRGFPSLVLELQGEYTPVDINYLHWQPTKAQIVTLITNT